MSRLCNNFPYFTNDKGQYYIPCWDVIEKSDLRGVDEKSAAIITALPYVTVKRGYWREAEGYRVLSLLPAKNFLEVNNLSISENELNAHLSNDQLIQALKGLYKTSKIALAKKLQTLKADVEKGRLKLNMFDAVAEFGEGDCVALFCATEKQEGFIQKNGDLGSLSKAMIFNNERDAESAVRRISAFGYYSQFQVVKIEMRVAEVGSIIQNTIGQTSHLSTSVIASVESAVQKRALQNALEQVSRDEIEHELQKRLSDTPSETKRRM